MSSHLAGIFEDEKFVEKIKTRLPYLFQVAELESSRAGKIGMDVGSLREKIIIALLIVMSINIIAGFVLPSIER